MPDLKDDVAGGIAQFIEPYEGCGVFTSSEKAALVDGLRLNGIKFRVDFDGQHHPYNIPYTTVFPHDKESVQVSMVLDKTEGFSEMLTCEINLIRGKYHYLDTIYQGELKAKGKKQLTDNEIFDVYTKMTAKVAAYRGKCACGQVHVVKHSKCAACLMVSAVQTKQGKRKREE